MKLLLTLFLGGIVACKKQTPYVVAQGDIAPPIITYYKDCRTGLCFAQVMQETNGSGVFYSTACVPCDSLKKFIALDCK